MQALKTFNHPVHAVNYFHKLLVQALKEYRPIVPKAGRPPSLFQGIGYYFTFATQPRQELDKMLYALCCFSGDGEIIFSHQGSFDVGLWAFRRLGLAKTADKIERTIRVCFKRHLMPLNPLCPFHKVEENLYQVDIDWFLYNKMLKQI